MDPGLALALGAAATIPPAAHAGEVPLDQRLQVTGTAVFVGNWTYGPSIVFASDVTPGVVLQGTVTSCGRPLQSIEWTAAPGGSRNHLTFDLSDYLTPNPYMPTPFWPYGVNNPYTHYEPIPERAEDFLGPTWEYTVTVIHPGMDPYTLTGASTVDWPRKAPTCDEVTEKFETAVAVKRWSDFKGAPKAGSKFKLTRTLAPGATVTYKWKLRIGRKTRLISTKRSVPFKPAYKGMEFEVRVFVKQPGKRNQQQLMIAQVK